MIAGFTAGERDYIRRELGMFFSTLPSVAEGFQLKTWRGGPDAGKPKLPPTAKGLIARGLMRLDNEGHFPRLFFTGDGPNGSARDDDRPPSRGPEKVRPCSTGTRHPS